MGRKSLPTFTAASSWLPGFEPAGYESAQLVLTPALTQPLFKTQPPSRPREVSVAAAVITFQALETVPDEPFQQTTKDALEAIENDSLEICIDTMSEVQVEQIASEVEEEAISDWPSFNPLKYAPAIGTKARIETNIRAIELVKQLNNAGEQPTDNQRHELLGYIGWGGLAKVFEEIDHNTLSAYQGQLKGLLSEEEFASARSSTVNAHYTDPVVITTMWDIVKRMGFKGGRIIEPAGGTGLFLAGMPVEIAQRSEITAVEMDKISGEILDTVFSGLGVKTHIIGIEKANVPTGFYDLAISNVPFGDYRTLETRKVGYAEWSIHNYFFGKAVDLVRPGGLIVFITSQHTMDSGTNAHRKWLNAHAQMLGAIRLPQNAFKKQANTEAVADIIVMRKRAAPMFGDVTDWLSLGNAPDIMLRPGQDLTYYNSYTRCYDEYGRSINCWFEKNPHLVVGQLELQSKQYGKELVPVFDGDAQAYKAKLQDCALAMPADCYEEAKKDLQVNNATSLMLNRVEATAQVKPGAFVIHKGHICISEGASWIDVDAAYKGTTRERLVAMIGIKQAARKLLDQQATSSDEAEFKSLQALLNGKYDAFVATHGNFSDRANTRVFRTDPDCPLLLSLQTYDEDKECFVKADIFSKRTAGRKEPPATADNVKDAMLISLGLHGKIVIADMAMRLQVAAKKVVQLLRDETLAYIDPQNGTWVPADEYLSGNIRNKIATATAAGKRYAANVAALNAVLPKDLGPGEVEVRLGAPWVPLDLVESFAIELIEADKGRVTISYSSESAAWSVKSDSYKPEYEGNRALNTVTWGTSKRCALVLIESALNQIPPKITITVDDRTVVDKGATLAAREKYEAIKAEFKKWAYADEARRDRLLRIYNDEFNQIVERRYDGSHLVLYGVSGVIEPYKHQMDAIWRIISGGNTLLAHVVGAGKTFVMVAAAMEMRRIGKAHKPMIAVPNHLLEQFTGDFVRFYPGAKVLMASKEDFVGDKRREFAARIATGDWDAVVITHSTFEKLPLRPETTRRFIGDMMAQARMAMHMADERGAKRTVKQCEKLIKTLEAKVERAMNENAKDDFVYFDDLGVDYLMIDEAHLFKNLMRISKMPTIAGLPNVSSNRAFDLWAKTSTIMEMRGGEEQGVTFATATPIANSIAEMHVMMKFLQPKMLKQLGLYEFDAWAATFGESVQGMEVAPDGSGYRLNTRFSRFVNIPDLMAIFKCVADIRTRSMLKLPTPNIKGGKPGTVKCLGSEELKAYTATLVERANGVRNGSVKPEDDNMLAITNSGRKAALDMRLIDPTLPFDPQGKVTQARDNIVRIWKESASYKGTQLVFCDLSTPNSKGFSVYTDLKAKLISKGIPAEEIAFIHDYDTDTAKAKLFRMVRAGVVRVLMGSTLKMGMGTNVQKRLKAIHQIDAPWRPADVEQRDGRGDRAGNECSEIELLRYVTEGSFDAYIWQLLETKMRFIDQIMTSTAGLRTVEDLSMGALTYAEIKAIASGNPLVLEKATVDAEVMKCSVLKDQWAQDRWRWSGTAKFNQQVLKNISANISAIELDAQTIEDDKAAGWTFKPHGALCEKAQGYADIEGQIGAQIRVTSQLMPKIGEAIVGTVGGMQIIVARYDGLSVSLKSQNGMGDYKLSRDGVSIVNAQQTGSMVIEKLISLIGMPSQQIKLAQRLEEECRDIEQRLQLEFEHQDKFETMLARQRQIESELDLDKNEAGTEAASETALKVVTEEETA